MRDSQFISYLKTLKPEDWTKMVNSGWTVKDVVAHMVGWEKQDVEIIKQLWETKSKPWWKNTDDYADFNDKSVEFYKNYTPEQLIAEWEMWQGKVQEEVDRIGEDNLKAEGDLFAFLFEGVEDNRKNGTDSHYKHHYNQIRKTVEGE